MNRWRPAQWLIVALSLTLVATTMLTPLGATAQSGPQFGNWGPGMAPPDSEGVDPSATSGAGGGTYGAAAPYGAVAPDAAMAPGFLVRGCPYDLRGTWRNQGTQSSGAYGASRSYSTTVSVRQFRSWIQAQQDDGTSYYGQCLGNRLQFDMYNGLQYIGRQDGTVYGSSWFAPGPLYGDAVQPAAGAAPAPGSSYIARPGLSASFTWTSWYGSGSETWTLTTGVYPGPLYPGPGYPGPIYGPTPWPPYASPTPSPTATLVPTATSTPVPPPPSPTAVPTASSLAPRIDALLPARGPAGTEVLVQGSGFGPNDNLVLFGPSLGLQFPDGTPANRVARDGSPDGVTLRFTVPDRGPTGILCDGSGNCVGVTAILLPQPASYEITVSNANGTSNSARFELMGDPLPSLVEPDLELEVETADAEE
jgi:hypothetical protein